MPKLLGTYEMELHDAVVHLIQKRCDVFVDVGAAEGYYAVGIARALRNTHVFGYDTSEQARRLLQAMAKANNVAARIEVLGACTWDALEETLQTAHSPAILCDCEGFEEVLMDPVRVPSLVRSRMIIEVHDDGLDGRIGALLLRRFEKTHQHQFILPKPRTGLEVRIRSSLTSAELAVAMWENRRLATPWLVLEPNWNP
jgi:hypothetical protein